MSNFENAFDLMKANIERKIADMEINGKIELSKLNANQYQAVLTGITRQFCKTGNYRLLSPDKITKYIKMAKLCDIKELRQNQTRVNDLIREAQNARDDLLLAVSLEKKSGSSDSFSKYKAILRRRYRRICAEIKSLQFGEKA